MKSPFCFVRCPKELQTIRQILESQAEVKLCRNLQHKWWILWEIMWFDQDLSIENGGLTMKKLGKNRRNRSLQGFYCVFSSIIQAIWLMSVGLPGIKIRSVVLKMLILGRSVYILYIIIYIYVDYIYASSVATRCDPVGFQVLQLEGFKMLSGFYVAYAFIWYINHE